LQHEEALAVLAVDPGATATEIKEAYRDLVKVWHPDRFGSDQRLRQKAEEKLQQIQRCVSGFAVSSNAEFHAWFVCGALFACEKVWRTIEQNDCRLDSWRFGDRCCRSRRAARIHA
jgi:hypothetical protein